MRTWSKWAGAGLVAGLVAMGAMDASAQEAAPAAAAAAEPVAAAAEAAAEAAAPAISVEGFTVNNTWMMVSTFLVFIMHLGFATVEAGLCRAKNTVNILFKNTLIPALGLLTYALVGFNLMYPGFSADGGNEWFGFAGFGLHLPEGGGTSAYNVGYTYWTDFLFQGMFAATCADHRLGRGLPSASSSPAS
jgi:Amt family ammonium transporter